MRMTETELPGIGLRRVLTTRAGERVAVVSHHGPAHDLFLFDDGADAPDASIRLDAAEARLLGAILDGTYAAGCALCRAHPG